MTQSVHLQFLESLCGQKSNSVTLVCYLYRIAVKLINTKILLNIYPYKIDLEFGTFRISIFPKYAHGKLFHHSLVIVN